MESTKHQYPAFHHTAIRAFTHHHQRIETLHYTTLHATHLSTDSSICCTDAWRRPFSAVN